MIRLAAHLATALTALAALSGAALAQESYPNRPLKIVHGFPAGAGTDIVARLVADPLGRVLGQVVVVEPRSGAGGNVGSEYVAKSPADGYTLYLGTAGTHAINVSLYKTLPFDVQKDFAPITILGDVPNVLVLHKGFAPKNLPDFLAYARANPGKINYGSSGNGTSMHLSGEQFKAFAKVDLTHIPYRGSPPVTTDLLAGQLQAAFYQVPTLLGQIKDGQFTALGVTTPQRVKAIPEIPTLAEAGLPGFSSSTWYGLFAPAATPRPIVERLNREVTALIRGELGKKFEEQGLIPWPTTPEEFARVIGNDIKRWGEIVASTGTKLD
ncbi:MAG: tripartite tricarboxylate transporter substrate binding protein [Alphaproteobacteria bacterium]|nr:tripartite tricarboxylate transporter substrate binding protein [Alphaproteobacteria bacterium]